MNTAPRTPKTLSQPTEVRLPAPAPAARWNGFLRLPENRLATRAARSLGRALLAGKRPSANPIVLHGPPGTGKSRLVTALVEQITAAPNGRTAQAVPAGDLLRPEEG